MRNKKTPFIHSFAESRLICAGDAPDRAPEAAETTEAAEAAEAERVMQERNEAREGVATASQAERTEVSEEGATEALTEEADATAESLEKIKKRLSNIDEQISELEKSETGVVGSKLKGLSLTRLKDLQNKFSDNNSVYDAVKDIFGVDNTGRGVGENTETRKRIWRENIEKSTDFRGRRDQNEAILALIKERVNDQIRLRELREQKTELENKMLELAEGEISEGEPRITVTEGQITEREFRTNHANFKIEIVDGKTRLTIDGPLDLPYRTAAGMVFKDQTPDFEEKDQTFTRMVVLYDLAFNEIRDADENRALRKATETRIKSYMQRLATQIGDEPENIFKPEIAGKYGFRREEAPAVATAPTAAPSTPRAAAPAAPEAAPAGEPGAEEELPLVDTPEAAPAEEVAAAPVSTAIDAVEGARSGVVRQRAEAAEPAVPEPEAPAEIETEAPPTEETVAAAPARAERAPREREVTPSAATEAIAELERTRDFDDYLAHISEENTRIFENRETYLNRRNRVSVPDDIQKILSQRDINWFTLEEGERILDGISRVNEAFLALGVGQDYVKGELSELLGARGQKNINFRTIFDRYVAGKTYDGNFRDFTNRLNELSNELEYWFTEEGKQDIQKWEAYIQLTNRLSPIIERQRAEGKSLDEIPEHKQWVEAREEVEEIRQGYGNPETLRAVRELKDLRENILHPIAKLMDSIESLSVVRVEDQTFYDRYSGLIDNLPNIPGTEEEARKERPLLRPIAPIESIAFYSVESLTSGEEIPERTSGMELVGRTTGVSLSREVKRKFPENLSEGAVLRIIFQIYTFQKLVESGSFQKNTRNRNELRLVSLPPGFENNPRVEALFAQIGQNPEEISSAEQLGEYNEFIEKAAEALDQNIRAMRILHSIYGEDDRGPTVQPRWRLRDRVRKFFSRRDAPGETLNLEHIGAGMVTKPSEDFMEDYMSGNAAIQKIIYEIKENTDNGIVYNMDKLGESLKTRLRMGVNSLFVDDDFRDLREAITGKENPTRQELNEAYERLSKDLDEISLPLSDEIIGLIRIGEVINHIAEEKGAMELSEIPFIRALQEEIRDRGYVKSPEEFRSIEDSLRMGIMIGTDGSVSLGARARANLEAQGFTVSGGVTVSTAGVDVGGAIDRGFTISKGDEEIAKITMGAHATALSATIGGHGAITVPVKTLDVSVGAAGGVRYGMLVYGVAAFEVRRNLNREAAENYQAEMTERELGKTASLITDNAPASEVVASMREIPGYGEDFQRLKEDFNLDDNSLIEVFGLVQERIRSSATEDVASRPFSIIGGGGFAGLVHNFPVVGGWVELKVGEEMVVVRSIARGQEELRKYSDAETQIQALIERERGKSVERVLLSETGHIIYDAETGETAILQGQHRVDLEQFDTLTRVNEGLRETNMGLRITPLNFNQIRESQSGRELGEAERLLIETMSASEPDNVFTLEMDTPYDHPANVKINIDPTLTDLRFSTIGNRIIFTGIEKEEMRNLNISRQDYQYSHETRGNTRLTVITITDNPLRTSEVIERESGQYIYQAGGQRPTLLSGRSTLPQANITEDYESFIERSNAVETITRMSQQEFNEWQTLTRDALRIQDQDKFEAEMIDQNKISEFTDKILEANPALIRSLSTVDAETYDQQTLPRLINLIQEEAKKEEAFGRELNNAELNATILNLVSKTFMDAESRGPEEMQRVFERNREFARNQVFIPFFKEVIDNSVIEISSPPEAMADKIIRDIENTDLTSENFESFEAGTIFLSTVGTNNIIGLRGTPYYQGDVVSGILNLQNYAPDARGIDGDIGKVLLEILSPLERDLEKPKEFMRSQIARKLLGTEGMYLILGHEDAMKVSKSFQNVEVNTENQDAFNRFRDIVLRVREAQHRGEKAVTINTPRGEFTIQITETQAGVGVYRKCTNPTLIGRESFEIWGERADGLASQRMDTNATIQARTQRRLQTLSIGVRHTIRREPEEIPEPTEPEDVSGGGTDTVAGGRTGSASQEGAGERSTEIEGFTSNE